MDKGLTSAEVDGGDLLAQGIRKNHALEREKVRGRRAQLKDRGDADGT